MADISFNIMLHLSINSIYKLMTTCKFINSVADEFLWKNKCYHDFKEINKSCDQTWYTYYKWRNIYYGMAMLPCLYKVTVPKFNDEIIKVFRFDGTYHLFYVLTKQYKAYAITATNVIELAKDIKIKNIYISCSSLCVVDIKNSLYLAYNAFYYKYNSGNVEFIANNVTKVLDVLSHKNIYYITDDGIKKQSIINFNEPPECIVKNMVSDAYIKENYDDNTISTLLWINSDGKICGTFKNKKIKIDPQKKYTSMYFIR